MGEYCICVYTPFVYAYIKCFMGGYIYIPYLYQTTYKYYKDKNMSKVRAVPREISKHL